MALIPELQGGREVQQVRYFVHFWSVPRTCGIDGSATQISGWKDDLETETRLTRNILSMCMKPVPILQRSSIDPSGVVLYGILVISWEVNLGGVRTYSHSVEVLFNFLGKLVGEFTAWYWQRIPSPVQRVNLSLCDQCVTT